MKWRGNAQKYKSTVANGIDTNIIGVISVLDTNNYKYESQANATYKDK